MENPEVDLTLALQLQAQFEEELRVSLLQQEADQRKALLLNQKSPGPSQKGKWNRRGEPDEPPQEKLSVPLTDPSWELIDPNPDIHMMFLTFNSQFFWGRLAGVEVRWSPRMTLCAGVCCYEGRGGLCSVRLSLPLLKLRPRKDLIETLLHEMIHAYLFVTANNRDRDGHGPEFHKHMYRINGVAGTKISVYHSFHDEVDVYRQHIWQCDGPCRKRRPYFGLVKRAMNRAPGPRDPWWQQHQQSCGGTYTKVQEPEGYGDKKNKKNGVSSGKKGMANSGDIRKFIGFHGKGKSLTAGSSSSHTKTDTRGKVKGGSSPPLKENIPGYKGMKSSQGNVKSNPIGGGNLYNLTKTSNVHGLGSTATGTVKSVDINNASRSKVHGFSGGSPARKKPRTGAAEGSGTTSGGKRAGSSGSGLAVRSGGGSRTVTVKGKTVTKTENDSNGDSSTLPVFHGQGFSLGGPTSGVSRLLSLSSSASQSSVKRDIKNNPLASKLQSTDLSQNKNDSLPSASQKPSDKYSSSTTTKSSKDSNRSHFAKCPVCNKDILESIMSQHLNDCIGEFDDDDDWDDSETVAATPVKAIGKDSLSISISSDDSDDCMVNGDTTSKASTSCRALVEVPSVEETYPCPVCSEMFTPSNINDHLDTHF